MIITIFVNYFQKMIMILHVLFSFIDDKFKIHGLNFQWA